MSIFQTETVKSEKWFCCYFICIILLVFQKNHKELRKKELSLQRFKSNNMLDLKKIDKEMTKSIQSYTREQLLEWVDSYNKRIAEAELEKKNTAHVNGTVINGTANCI